jgi:hypothetical protein
MEINKISFTFFRVYYDFIGFLQVHIHWVKIWKLSFTSRPFQVYKQTLQRFFINWYTLNLTSNPAILFSGP